MARERDACPLCGAKLAPTAILNAAEELVGAGVLACRCPYCQGYFELRPAADCIEIGYLQQGRFDVVLTLPAPGLTVLCDLTNGNLRLKLGERQWKFSE